MKKFTMLDQTCVNALRMLSIDAVQKANSGHPGLPLGAAPMAYVLWTQFLKHNPQNPDWYDRDRFLLSAGHGSALLYSLLYATGYDLTLNDLKQFRQWHSKTPGHPESEITHAVEVTTGPLGQGFANGVGMAIAEAYLAARYNKPGFNIVDHYTYALVSDGDLMEGVASEAASLAGQLRLGKLIYLYDSNHITLSASTRLSFTENVEQRFSAYHWHTQIVENGNDLTAIANAIHLAKKEKTRPSIIIVHTHIGYGSPHKQDTYKAHGSPLGEEEVKLTKQFFNWPETPDFYVPEKALNSFRKVIQTGIRLEKNWQEKLTSYGKKYPTLFKEFNQLMQNILPEGWDKNIPFFPAKEPMATRDACGKVMQAINPNLPGFIGGSADLNESTKTALINFGNFQSPETAKGDRQGKEDGGWNYTGRNLFYGVREHAMGAISNGLAAFNGIIPFTATFLAFSDYMRPPMRLACLAQLRVIFIFTHDSIGLGEDGPTHQPVEQLASLRAVPNLYVIRPADANETAIALQIAIETPHQPTALVFTRQKVPVLDRKKYAPAKHLKRGAYILADAPDGKPDIILIATGSEVQLIVGAYEKLSAENIKVRIVSMPCWELFNKQSQKYKDTVLPPAIKKRLAVEAGVSQGWSRYIGDEGIMISVETFGASAPGEIVMKKYGFTTENVYKKAIFLLTPPKQTKTKRKKP
ncbi:MAG: transketolase [Gammaproteobacteria bacterium]|nr:transketolase [Gammaproteobacteria bacterium]